MLKHLLTSLLQELNLPSPLIENKEKEYEVVLNEETHLLFKDLDPGFSCKSLIAPIPTEDHLEDLYILCMKANFLGQGTKGAAIAIDPSLKNFLFTLSITEEMNYRLFKETIEDFVNYLNYWKKRIGSKNT